MSHAAGGGGVRTEDWRPLSLYLAAGQAAAAAIIHTSHNKFSFCSINNILGFKLLASDSKLCCLNALDNVESLITPNTKKLIVASGFLHHSH